ncbi:branched-chain amino acid ABC transporter substrate-binding protein [Bradyrhizobium sp. BWA-3-5]|uniref:branched-chain amino acid ABC transporter substrate-binding protein n=1 Tax=Bradyrhizobium sp. BWA-3-5 TaxID=3080013 RepID=UPI00293EAA9B|nr:branched-chain amino acid ABC transporter substrate-binding protein [Bradyrhizobium sp. BWA-3-5]WOH63845.1 branched-chain amino acid ABC transporter substrate-binding protein [Bradyrhizobium sp. BWA-3-5]
MSIYRASSAACAAVLACALVSTAPAADISIAVAGPMTGSTAAIGAQLREGAAAAVDALNASGLLPDTKIILNVADDACDPKQAVAVANRLAADRVRLVVGHFCSSSSIPASDVYAEAQLIQISPGSTNPQLTERGLKTVFRVCGRDDQQGAVAAEYILRYYRNNKIAVLDDKSTAGKGIADVVESRLQQAGQSVVRQSYVAGEKDYMALVSRMKRDGIQIAYIGGYYTEIGLIVRQAAEAGAGLTIMANDPLMTREFWAITSKAGDGTLFTFMPDATKNPQAADAVARLKASNRSADGYTLYAYAAVQAWADAVKRAGSFNALRVAAALRSQPIETVIGTVRFDSKGDNAAPGFVVYRWHDSNVEAVEQN